MPDPDVVLLDCACGELLAVPVLHVDESNEIHVDHDWLARHTAGHVERSEVTAP